MGRKPLHRLVVAKMATDALERGATVKSVGRIDWKVAGNCKRPIQREIRGVPWERWGVRPHWWNKSRKAKGMQVIPNKLPDGPEGVSVTVEARCRRCSTCLRARAGHWAARAQVEIAASTRTWFGTLTLEPEKHLLFQSRTRARLDAGCVDLEALPPDERFAELERELCREVQLMWKRLRKAGHRFRFMLVVEAHKSGLAHYHCLVHEVGEPIRKRQLEAEWPHGFSKWKLVDQTEAAHRKRASWYVCKYISKNVLCAIRSSIRYGKEISLEISNSSYEIISSYDDLYSVKNKEELNSLPEHKGGIDLQKAQSELTVTDLKGSADGDNLSGDRISDEKRTGARLSSAARAPADGAASRKTFAASPRSSVGSAASALHDADEDIPF